MFDVIPDRDGWRQSQQLLQLLMMGAVVQVVGKVHVVVHDIFARWMLDVL